MTETIENINGRLLENYSIEITPKDAATIANAKIPADTNVSITFLPSDDEASRVHAALCLRQAGLAPVPHFSARRLRSREEFSSFLDVLAYTSHPDHAFVIAGDPRIPVGSYEDALSLIRTEMFVQRGYREIGIAGYPDGHPDIETARLWAALSDKVDVINGQGLASEIVTQFSFDAQRVLTWLKELRERGIHSPVRIGIPGPASVKTLLRFAARCGVAASAQVMAKYGLSLTRLLSTAGPDALVRELSDGLASEDYGAIHIHLYPFGGLDKAVEWANRQTSVASAL